MLYLVNLVCLILIAATMLARGNDLRWKKGLHWNARLIGFIMAGFAPFGMAIFDRHPSISLTLFMVGVTLVFLTTPYMPPWWKWITKGDESNYQGEERRGSDGRT